MSIDKKKGDIESQIEVIVDDVKQPKNSKLLGFSFLESLGEGLKAETRGIERVPENERNSHYFNSFTLFLSPNLTISALSTGCIATTMCGLDFWTATIIAIIFSFIGALPVGLFSVFGARFGLRQQILSRFLVGNYAARVFAFLNVVSCIGWNAVNTIAAVELLVSISKHDGTHFPPTIGCIIIVVSTLVFSFFGYEVVHTYERYSWIPNIIVFFIIIARLKLEGNFSVGTMETGNTEAGNVLTYISIVFGFIAGWTPSAADYSVYVPADTAAWKIFMSTVSGLFFPSIVSLIIGAAMGCTTLNNPQMAKYYKDEAIGGLTYGILVPESLGKFGSFCCVLLFLSTIANNLPGSYSLSLSVQCVWSRLAACPRLFWCVLGNVISLAISIPAYYSFAAAMSNFLSIIAYNVSIYIGICLSEHLVFRKNSFKNYNLYFDQEKKNFTDIPIGYAGFLTMCIGWLFAIIGMDQTWFIGLAARKISETGGDIGWELCISSSFIVYLLLRPLELKYIEKSPIFKTYDFY